MKKKKERSSKKKETEVSATKMGNCIEEGEIFELDVDTRGDDDETIRSSMEEAVTIVKEWEK